MDGSSKAGGESGRTPGAPTVDRAGPLLPALLTNVMLYLFTYIQRFTEI